MPDSAMRTLHLWLEQETWLKSMYRVYDMPPTKPEKRSCLYQQGMELTHLHLMPEDFCIWPVCLDSFDYRNN
jgi:hypothetical protein